MEYEVLGTVPGDWYLKSISMPNYGILRHTTDLRWMRDKAAPLTGSLKLHLECPVSDEEKNVLVAVPWKTRLLNELGANGETSPVLEHSSRSVSSFRRRFSETRGDGEEHVSPRGVTRGCLALTGPVRQQDQASFLGQVACHLSSESHWSKDAGTARPDGQQTVQTIAHSSSLAVQITMILTRSLIPIRLGVIALTRSHPYPPFDLPGPTPRTDDGPPPIPAPEAVAGPRYKDLPGPNNSLRDKVAPPIVNLPPSGPVSPKKGRRMSKDTVFSKPTGFVYCSLAVASLLYIVPRDDVQAASSGDSIDLCFRPQLVLGHSTTASYDNKDVGDRDQVEKWRLPTKTLCVMTNSEHRDSHRDDPYRDNLWSEGAPPPAVRGNMSIEETRISVTPTPENPNTCLSVLAHPVENMPVPQDSPNDGVRDRIPSIPDVAGALLQNLCLPECRPWKT
ncbi:hypothetical protein EDB83DRAFT_2309863 [Lactarius deliciosus]|nr:hypothetical protein EDB83DRAFT_2309863 [Lactarius deliciosus]